MNAAIYARKSTEQRGVTDENKSVTRQIENAREFAASQGWTVKDAHVFVDDGISGTETGKRVGFMRMLAAAEARGGSPFSVVIVSDDTRFARTVADGPHFMKRFYEADVLVWSYLLKKCITPLTDEEQLHGVINFYSGQKLTRASSGKSTEAGVRVFCAVTSSAGVCSATTTGTSSPRTRTRTAMTSSRIPSV